MEGIFLQGWYIFHIVRSRAKCIRPAIRGTNVAPSSYATQSPCFAVRNESPANFVTRSQVIRIGVVGRDMIPNSAESYFDSSHEI